MRYAGLNKNDMINGKGVCVSVWLQGCPHKCSGCHNPETWDPQGGTEINRDVLIEKIKKAITANGIIRNVSILGGEPLAPYNIDDLFHLIINNSNEIPEEFLAIIDRLEFNYKPICFNI